MQQFRKFMRFWKIMECFECSSNNKKIPENKFVNTIIE